MSPSVPVQMWKLSFRYREPSKKLYRVPTRLRPFIILMSASVVIFKVLNKHGTQIRIIPYRKRTPPMITCKMQTDLMETDL